MERRWDTHAASPLAAHHLADRQREALMPPSAPFRVFTTLTLAGGWGGGGDRHRRSPTQRKTH